MAAKRGGNRRISVAVKADDSEAAMRTSQARLELPTAEMERVRRAARSVGLSLSAFIRQSVLERTADTEHRMRL